MNKQMKTNTSIIYQNMISVDLAKNEGGPIIFQVRFTYRVRDTKVIGDVLERRNRH